MTVGTGMDRNTGKLISGWDHVLQSIVIIITTGIGERMLRRWFGSQIPQLLGESMNKQTIVAFFAALVTALEVKEPTTGLPREPRFKIVRIKPISVDRSGKFAVEITGTYMPRGHLGDFTPAGTRTITVQNGNGALSAS